MPVKVSVVILNYNGLQYLRQTLDSLNRQTYKDFETIFVDNDSRDGSVTFIEKTYPDQIRNRRLRIISNVQNTGFAKGNNIGYAAANATHYVVLLNNDVRAARTWLAELVRTAEEYPDLGLIGTSYYDHGTYHIWKSYNKRKLAAISTLAGEDAVIERQTLHAPHLIETLYASGNGLLIRKKLFKRPFDPDYFAYAEDVYLGWSARIRGIPVVVNTKATLAHEGGGTKKANPGLVNKFLTFHGTKNQLMNALIFYEAWTFARVLPLLTIAQIGRLVDNPRKIPQHVHAYWWVASHLGSIARKRHAIQRTRTVRDRDILPHMSGKLISDELADQRYNLVYRTAIRVLNRTMIFYCWLVRLHIAELTREATGIKRRKNRGRA